MMVASSLVLAVLVICAAELTSAVDPRCPRVDPRGYSVLFRHPTDCGKYYECSNGNAVLMPCPAGLYFNTELKVCDWPQNVKCVLGCEALTNSESGAWTSSSCTSGVSKVGDSCSIQCKENFILKGTASIQCTENGWNSVNGDNIPSCVPEICVVEVIDEVLNKTLSVPASLLFVLDESGSVGPQNFLTSKEFIKHIVDKYPLSATRSAGVITFSSGSLVHVILTEDNTQDFRRRVDQIPYGGGGTNILSALETAYAEIQSHPVHPLTLVFLVTDGESETDGTPAADKIKALNQPLFTIGINNKPIVQLEQIASVGPNHLKNFFHIKNYTVLESIGAYLNPPPDKRLVQTQTVCKPAAK